MTTVTDPELYIICVDNSDWMRNEDYLLSRFAALRQALNLLISSTTKKRCSFCLITMANSLGPQIEVGPSCDASELVRALDNVTLSDSGNRCNLIQSLQLALMALNSRPRSFTQSSSLPHSSSSSSTSTTPSIARLFLFLGSPPDGDPSPVGRALKSNIAQRLVKEGCSIDVLCFGEAATQSEWCRVLEEFVTSVLVASRVLAISKHATINNSHLMIVPPYGMGNGVDSLAFHMLKNLVKDRETARVVWQAFGGQLKQQSSSSSSSQSANTSATSTKGSLLSEQTKVPPTQGDSEIPLLRTPAPMNSCRQAAAVAEAYRLQNNVDSEAQLPPVSFSLTLALSNKPSSSSSGSSHHKGSSSGDEKGGKTSRTTVMVPVQMLTREILLEIPCGRVVTLSSGMAEPAPEKGNLAFVRLSSTMYQFVWRDLTTRKAEIESIAMKHEANATLRPLPDGRLLFIRILRQTYIKKLYFWLQFEHDDARENDIVNLINSELESSSTLTTSSQTERTTGPPIFFGPGSTIFLSKGAAATTSIPDVLLPPDTPPDLTIPSSSSMKNVGPVLSTLCEQRKKLLLHRCESGHRLLFNAIKNIQMPSNSNATFDQLTRASPPLKSPPFLSLAGPTDPTGGLHPLPPPLNTSLSLSSGGTSPLPSTSKDTIINTPKSPAVGEPPPPPRLRPLPSPMMPLSRDTSPIASPQLYRPSPLQLVMTPTPSSALTTRSLFISTPPQSANSAPAVEDGAVESKATATATVQSTTATTTQPSSVPSTLESAAKTPQPSTTTTTTSGTSSSSSAADTPNVH